MNASIIRFAFVAAALTPFAAAAQAPEEPSAIAICTPSHSQFGEDDGVYTATDPGDSDCACYVRDDGGFALGQFGGQWWGLPQGDCVLRANTVGELFGGGPSCDPTVINGVSAAPGAMEMVDDMGSQLGDTRGVYRPQACGGDSESACFLRDDGLFSVGLFGGEWFVLNRDDCQPVPGTLYVNLRGDASGIESTGVFVGYEE